VVDIYRIYLSTMVALSALPMNIAQRLKEASTFLPGKFQSVLQNRITLARSALSR
jgi:hypothetical protein